MRKLTITRWVFAAVLCLATTAWGNAQSAVDGAIGGTVMDNTGAAVPSAKVVVRNNGTNAEMTAVSDGAGFFNAVHLQPGSYTVTIVAAGFNTYQSKDVQVQVGLTTTIQPKLAVGSTATTVEVTALLPDLNFTSPDFTSNLSSKTIESLPVNGRRWSDLTLLTPGVVSDSNGFGLLSFRGISPLLNNIEIDGADDNQGFYSEERGRTREGYSTSQAAVREFQVNAGVYSAEYGRAAGGVVNSITKSGTNQLHGTLYFYDRDNDWGATNPFTKITTPDSSGKFVQHPYKPKDWRKEWGLALGGPLVRDKLFFFYVYDQYRRNFPGTGTAFSPGVFFTQPDASLPAGQTCNTATGVISGGGSTIDTAACVLAARLKYPSYAQGASLYNADLGELASDLGPVPRTGNQLINTPKIDWQITGKQHASFLFHRLRWDSPGGVQTQSSANYAIDSFGTDFVKLDYGLARLDSLITSTISNEIRYQYGRELNNEGRQTPSAYTTKHFTGTTGVPVQVSVVSSSGFTAGAPYYSFRYAYPDERKWQVADTANWVHGSHNMKFGLDMVHNYDLQNNLYEGNGVYSYSFLQNLFADEAKPTGTCDSTAEGSATTKNNVTIYPVGNYPCYGSLTLGFGNPVFDLATTDYGFFVQDDWKATPRLTLNLGLRYDYEALPKIGSQFVNPAFPATANHPSDTNNFGPRIGFAYDPFGLGKTVVRGGYGMYFGRVFNSLLLTAYSNSGVGGQGTVQFRNTVRASGSTPLVTFPNVVPPGTGALSSNIDYLAKNLQSPMVHEFDLTVQQDVGRQTTLSVTYLGALGRELPNFINTNLNGTYTSSVTVGPVGGTNCGPLKCGTVLTNKVYAFNPSSRNNPNFQGTTEIVSNVNSNYNGLVGEIQNHTFKLVQFDANYTWSHALDFNQNQSTNGTTNSWLLRPGGNGHDNYGNSNFNVPNRFVAYAMVYVPSRATGWASYLLNGWQINPLLQMQSGLPYTLEVSGFQPSATVGGVSYSSFDSSLYGSGVRYIPQIGRNTYRRQRAIVTDVRAQKNFIIEGKYTLELLGELFNVANHQNVTFVNTTGYTFSGSNLNYNSAAGSVSNANSNYTYSPRQVQLAVRLQF